MPVDRFGYAHAANLPYARGKILADTEDDFAKLQRAWSVIRRRGPRSIHIFTGLEHSLPLTAEELEFADHEIGPPATADLLIKFVPPETLEHFGGPKKYAAAVNASLTKLGYLMREPQSICELLLGKGV